MAEETAPDPRQVIFRYEKSHLCRVIHCDGAWGGLTPHGDVHMALYSEHRAMPSQSVYEVGPDNRTATEVPIEERLENVREIEVEAILTYEGAVALRNWLNDRIKNIDEVRAELNARGAERDREES